MALQFEGPSHEVPSRNLANRESFDESTVASVAVQCVLFSGKSMLNTSLPINSTAKDLRKMLIQHGFKYACNATLSIADRLLGDDDILAADGGTGVTVQIVLPSLGGRLAEVRQAVGIKITSGIVLLTVTKQPDDPGSDSVRTSQSVEPVSSYVGMVYTSMPPEQCWTPPDPASTQGSLSTHEHIAALRDFTLGDESPGGIAPLIASYDDNGLHLFQLDPSGSYLEQEAFVATGKEQWLGEAKSFLQKQNVADIDVDTAIQLAILSMIRPGSAIPLDTINGSSDWALKNSMQIGIFDPCNGFIFQVLSPAQVLQCITETLMI